MNRARDRLLRTLHGAANADGIVETNVTLLVAWTGLSRPSIFRALEELTREGLIQTEGKRGPGGGLIIGLKKVSKKVSKRSQKSQERNAFNHSVQGDFVPSEPEPNGANELVSNSSHGAKSAAWFVCCIWYDDNGALWCHGDDGYPAYIPCRSEAEAMKVAKVHRAMIHKTEPEDHGRFPAVDICKAMGQSKVIHERIGQLER